jgi:hypothetical protein
MMGTKNATSLREAAAMNPHTNASPIGFSYASDGRASTVLWGYMVPAALRVLGMSFTAHLRAFGPKLSFKRHQVHGRYVLVASVTTPRHPGLYSSTCLDAVFSEVRRAVGRCILPLPTPTSYGS